MEITKKLKNEIEKVMDDYWSSYFNGDFPGWTSYLPDHYRNIGSTKVEIWNSKKEIVDFTKKVADQMVGMAELRNKTTQIISYEPHFMVHELGDLYVNAAEGWIYYAPLRLSSLLEETDDGWKILHQHGSYPDAKAEEGETFGFDELKIENKKLQDAIQGRTIELEQKSRSLEIEAALERVRSKTMAMHSSDDVSLTVVTLFDELLQLGLDKSIRCGIGILKDKEYMETWSVTHAENGEVDLKLGILDMSVHPLLKKIRKNWENNKESFTYELIGEEVKNYYRALNDAPDYHFHTDLAKLPNKTFHSSFYFSSGVLFAFTDNPISAEAADVLNRFAGVFGQTYTRFLDLKKAEAQTREAQIETALERVRSTSMAMHSSDQISNVVKVLYRQLTTLIENFDIVNIQVNQDASKDIYFWNGLDVNMYNDMYHVPYGNSKLFEEINRAWKAEDGLLNLTLTKTEKDQYFDIAFLHMPTPTDRKNMIYNADGMVVLGYFNHNSAVHVIRYSQESFSEESKNVITRFSKVFEQTYTRFLDLQKAEAQTREAQIESALERVRSKAMAMRSSEDIGEATTILFKEIEKLKIETIRCGILIIHENMVMDVWTTSTTKDDEIIRVSGQINMKIHPLLINVYDGWKNGDSYTEYEIAGKDGKMYYQALNKEINYKLPSSSVLNEKHLNTCFMFNDGALFAFTKNEIPETARNIYGRFAKVFGLTYQRYKELIESEKREKEAKKQSSLDRVRGEIASMRSTEDLNRITPIIWQELTNLGVPFFRCGVFIIDEENENVQVFLSDPTGKSLGLMNLEFDTTDLTKSTVKAWRNHSIHKAHWSREEFIEWTKTLIDLGKIDTSKGYQGGDDAPLSLDLHFIPFKQGMLYVGNQEPLSDNQIELVKNLSESFSIAYSRYEDFTKLELAKKNVEAALTDLKATQKQLIQSEKMASLGELTAGIAHEIQNPLNFVNNFSEVSNELIDEMNEEIEKGDLEEAQFIAKDIKQNLEKINHHGKRADAIVKGMLQHSRKSTAEKVPTDINKLADEYLRLAYHGLRAKDKSFNATLKTDFDESIGLVNVIPQDIGRVILNLITNAFYACAERSRSTSNERRKLGEKGYEPVVELSTRIHPLTPASGGKLRADIQSNAKADSPLGPEGSMGVWDDSPLRVGGSGCRGVDKDHILISIKDNGSGIPKHVIDKIFQPFFTTKPTGEGTGLGLSMSYDIIKAHDGALTVKTEHEKYTQFDITLPIIN